MNQNQTKPKPLGVPMKKWYRKNIFKQPVKRVDYGAVKKKYRKFWFIAMFAAYLLFFIFWLLGIYYPNFVKANFGFAIIGALCLFGIYIFLEAYFCFKYKMTGNIASFPTASGKLVPYIGIIYFIGGLGCIVLAIVFFIKLVKVRIGQ